MANLEIENPTPYIESMGSQTSPYQWLRELPINCFESKATRVEVDPFNDILFKVYGGDKMLIADNGEGMTGKQLVSYMRHLLRSGKPIGGVGEHMGIGARISTLGWNKYGVVCISLRDGETNMVWMHKDPVSGRYALSDFEIDDDYVSSIRLSNYPNEFEVDGVPWSQVIPDWVKEAGHGTVVVLLGDTPKQNSNLGDLRIVGEGWRSATATDVRKGAWTSPRQIEKVTYEGQKIYRTRPELNYLNGRFWVLKKTTEITGYGTWETSPINSDWQAEEVRVRGFEAADRPSRPVDPSDAPLWVSSRSVIGGLRSIFESKFDVKHGIVELDHPNLPAKVHWFLRSGSSASGWNSLNRGYVAALYQDEIYERGHALRQWGIAYRAIQDRVFLIVEPEAATGLIEDAKGSDGVRPNAERSTLLWGRENSLTLPWDDWGSMFRSPEYMPAEILDAIKEHVASLPASENVDPEIIRRVMEHVEATYETEDQVLQRKADSAKKFKGSRDVTEPDENGSTVKTKYVKKLVQPPSPKREDGDPLPDKETGETPGPDEPSAPTPGTVEAKKKTRPIKITAAKKPGLGGPLLNQKGKVPGALITKKGTPPLVRWVMQTDIIEAMSDENGSGLEEHAGVLWDAPGGDNPAGLLRLAKDHWAVEQVISRFGEDLPHVDEKEIRQEVQNSLAGAVLLRVLTIRKMRGRYGTSDALTKMLDTPALTDMLLLSNMEYDAVSTKLKMKFGVAPKVRKVV